MEISASGYTKELQQDDCLLHPEGPEGDGDEDEDDESPESTDDTHQAAAEETINMEEFKHAMLELEGLKMSAETLSEENNTEEPEGARCEQDVPSEDLQTEMVSGISEDFGRDEAEDQCPDLVDLSACNKEFRPFR